MAANCLAQIDVNDKIIKFLADAIAVDPTPEVKLAALQTIIAIGPVASAASAIRSAPDNFSFGFCASSTT
jgi:hypothetical protein